MKKPPGQQGAQAVSGGWQSAEEALELVGPALAAGRVASAAFFQRFFQLAQELALVLGEFDRGFHGDVAVQVAGVAGAHALDALAAQAELLAGLGAFGDVDGCLARERRHLNLAAQRCGDEAHRHLAMQVVAVALEDVVLLEANLDVQIARWATVGARFAGAADAHAMVDAGRNFDFQRFLLLELALALAGGAGLGNDLACAAAVWAGLLHTEETLAHLHRAATLAGSTGLGTGPGFGTAAVAGVAGVPGGDTDLRILTARGFFQRHFHGVAQVAATVHAARAATPAPAILAKHVAEDVAKRFRKAAKPFRARSAGAAHVRIDARVAILVVGGTLLCVGQHFVGLLGLLELVLGHLGGITLVAVRMVLHRQLAIGVLGNAEDFVVVSFGHG